MDEFQLKLAERFVKQEEFTRGYSPLYARIFGILAEWFSSESAKDPVVSWLLEAGQGRASFDLPLLLLAALHFDVLTDVRRARDLARYYPSVGGMRNPEEPELRDHLRAAILSRRDQLGDFIRTSTVQTNETTRGFSWLFPACGTGFSRFHLVDLGASAGLNLVADQRSFILQGPNHQLRFGHGEIDEFSIMSRNPMPVAHYRQTIPQILSRIGCDLSPLILNSRQDELKLTSFVWADQVTRLAVLRRGIAALHALNQQGTPIRIHQARLPDGLTGFLEKELGQLDDAPVVLYNTYLTTYLHDKGASLRSQIGEWARKADRPVLWLQLETIWDGPQPPVFGWVGWTADLWLESRHHSWQLAWAHPHGTEIHWLDGFSDWMQFWVKRQNCRK